MASMIWSCDPTFYRMFCVPALFFSVACINFQLSVLFFKFFFYPPLEYSTWYAEGSLISIC